MFGSWMKKSDTQWVPLLPILNRAYGMLTASTEPFPPAGPVNTIFSL